MLSLTISLDLPPHLAALPWERYTFGIRASVITLGSGGFPLRIELAEICGSETFLHLLHEQLQVVGLLDSVQNSDIGQTALLGSIANHSMPLIKVEIWCLRPSVEQNNV